MIILLVLFWIVVLILLGYACFPAVSLLASLFRTRINPEPARSEISIACIITAYKDVEIALPQIDSLLNADYVRVMVNIPREKDKRDYELLATLENPQRFGFPVLVVLNQEGKRIHTQDSWYLEQDKDYDREKVEQFFKMWTVKAVNPSK